ncbi:MAG: hypothetical protein QXX20_01875 [Candidatus Thermoplasmatota archaeon]
MNHRNFYEQTVGYLFVDLKKILVRLIISLCIWGIIAIVAWSFPVVKEPDNLPLESWSYYHGRSDVEQFLLKNRDMLLVVLFVGAMISEIVVFFREFFIMKR